MATRVSHSFSAVVRLPPLFGRQVGPTRARRGLTQRLADQRVLQMRLAAVGCGKPGLGVKGPRRTMLFMVAQVTVPIVDSAMVIDAANPEVRPS